MSTNKFISNQALRAAEIIGHRDDIKKDVEKSFKKSTKRTLGAARDVYWRTFHPLTFGAAVALTDVDITEVALIRQSYGNTQLWQLPGGGIDKLDKKAAKERVLNGVYANRLPKELFLPSALREVSEELGVTADVDSATHIGNYPNFRWLQDRVRANRDTLGIFHVPLSEIDVTKFEIQESEIDEVRLWDLEEVIDRTDHASRSDSNMAWYLGSVASKLVETQELAA